MKELTEEDLGPHMKALDERGRKFVMLVVHARNNPTQAAKLAGYSASSDGYLRVQGHRLMRQDRIIAALREEAERRIGAASALAIVELADLVKSKDLKTKAAAIDSVLDRTGFGRRSTQDIRVEHVDSRSTAELMALVDSYRERQALPKPLPVIEGEVVEVKNDAA